MGMGMGMGMAMGMGMGIERIDRYLLILIDTY